MLSTLGLVGVTNSRSIGSVSETAENRLVFTLASVGDLLALGTGDVSFWLVRAILPKTPGVCVFYTLLVFTVMLVFAMEDRF